MAGQIRLVVQAKTPPSIAKPVPAGSGLVLIGSGGPSNLLFYLLGSTNVARPLPEWDRIGTNRFSGSGTFSPTNPWSAAMPESFYSIQIP